MAKNFKESITSRNSMPARLAFRASARAEESELRLRMIETLSEPESADIIVNDGQSEIPNGTTS